MMVVVGSLVTWAVVSKAEVRKAAPGNKAATAILR